MPQGSGLFLKAFAFFGAPEKACHMEPESSQYARAVAPLPGDDVDVGMGHHLVGARAIVKQDVRSLDAPPQGALGTKNAIGGREQVLDR